MKLYPSFDRNGKLIGVSIPLDEEALRAEVQYEAFTAALKSAGPTVEYQGRFYITLGNPGFNSPANNGSGYRTQALALAAIRRYSAKGGAR